MKVGELVGSKVVVLERTSLSAGNGDVATIFGPAEKAIEGIDRQRYGLLIDVRAAPGRNDPDFEKQFEPHRQRMQRGFRRVAVVVKTVHGKLQVQRYAREDGIPNAAFDDRAAAVKWLEESTLRS